MTALEEYNFNLLQIQMAASGCISGELKEWPALIRAMDYFGFKVSRRISVLIVKDLCSLIYPKKFFLVRFNNLWFFCWLLLSFKGFAKTNMVIDFMEINIVQDKEYSLSIIITVINFFIFTFCG